MPTLTAPKQFDEVLVIDHRMLLCRIRREGSKVVVQCLKDAGATSDERYLQLTRMPNGTVISAQIRGSFNAGRSVRMSEDLYKSLKVVAEIPARAVPTSDLDKKRIEALAKYLFAEMEYLYSRWQDEKQYEDIKDYGKRIESKMLDGFIFLKMTKSPFGFQFKLEGSEATYAITMKARSYGWGRL